MDASGPEQTMRLALAWQGPLPHPDDFKAYPEHVQDAILKMHLEEHERRMDRQDKALQAAISLDLGQSGRDDRLVDAEIAQASAAQDKTFSINLLLVVGAILSMALGHDSVAIALIGALAVVNVATLFVPLRRSHAIRQEESDKKSK